MCLLSYGKVLSYIMKKCIIAALFLSILGGCTLNPFYEDPIQQELYAYIENDKFGFVDVQGEVVIPNEYDFVHEFSEGFAAVCVNGLYGYVTGENNLAIPCEYDEVLPFRSGIAAVCKGGFWGFINSKGEPLSEFKCDLIEPIIGGYKMLTNGTWDLCNATLSNMAATGYEMVGDFCEGYAMVKKDGKYGFIDENYREIVPCIYSWVGNFSDGITYALHEGKYGYIDKSGGVVIPFAYDKAGDFNSGYARVENGGRSFFIDRSGVEVIFDYTDVWNFNNGVAVVVKDGKYGLIDSNCKEIVPCEMDDVGGNKQLKILDFSQGIAPVLRDEKWGYVDTMGKMKFPYQFEDAKVFSEDVAAVKMNGKWGFIDKNGEKLTQFVYDLDLETDRKYAPDSSIGIFKDGYCLVNRDNLYGCLDSGFKEVVPCKYEQSVFFDSGVFYTYGENSAIKYITSNVKGVSESAWR